MQEAETLLANLKTAIDMQASGTDAKTIKLATGWEKGGDGDWRMEVPDLQIKTARKLPDGTEYERSLWDIINTTNGKLEEFIDAPELFEAYPKLKNIKLESSHNLPPTVGGRFIASESKIKLNSIALGLSQRDEERIEHLKRAIARTYNWTEKDEKNRQLLGITSTPEEIRQKNQTEIDAIEARYMNVVREVLIHEVQHAIQHLEGFATGSNVKYFEDNPVKDKKYVQKYEDAIQKEYAAKKDFAEYSQVYHLADRYFELDDIWADAFGGNQSIDEEALVTEQNNIEEEIKSAGAYEAFEKYRLAKLELDSAREALKKNIPPYDAYMRTAGEVEARNAQTRSNMSMEERINTLLSETEDVAEEDKIYLEQLVSGVSEMSPLRRKPADLDDFLNMTGHTRPPRLNFDNTGEMFDAFKKHIIDANIVTPEGYRLVAKPGHFFVFCCGKKDNTHKGFIKRASSAKNALEMVKNSLIKPEEMSGFEMDRIRNIQTFVDVLTDPDFSYRHNNKIIYGKKYDDISNANGYTSVVLNISDNIISPIHSGIEKFNRQRLEKENITWYANLESDIPLDNARTTESVASREQLSDRLNNDSTKKQKVKSKNKNNKEFRFSVDVTDGNGRAGSAVFAFGVFGGGAGADRGGA